MAYGYHNEKLKKNMERLSEEFMNTCCGRNISIGSLTCDETGSYSDKKLMDLLEELVNADIRESDRVWLDEERLDKELDYLKTLLYVMIRANQAKPRRLVRNRKDRRGFGDRRVVCDDSFAGIISQAEDGIRVFGLNKDAGSGWPKKSVIDPDTEVTAETIYRMLSGRELLFPDPYNTLKRPEIPVEDETDTSVEELQEESGEECLCDLCDCDDPDFGEYCGWDPTEWMTPEEADEYHRNELYNALRAQEQSSFYGTDDDTYADLQSRKDYEEDIREEEAASEEAAARNIDPEEPGSRERYERAVRLLKLGFEDKEAYLRMYEHLAEITRPECKGLEDKIRSKADAWLRESGKTLFSDDAAFDSVYRMLYSAVCEAGMRIKES